MSEFRNEIDIANRACQHCGVTRIGSAGFTEDSKAAGEIGSVYGKLRRAELRRNVWAFATRQTVLRPVDTTTMVLSPALWVADTTYFVGSLVSDDLGTIWKSRIPNNLGYRPQTTPAAWEPYFGALTVQPYDSGSAYFAGELVYTTAGDGKARVFLSLENSNDDNPATTAAWDATITYRKNQVVTRSAVAYMSLVDLNLNNDPAAAPALWSSVTTYSIGNTVGASNGLIYTSIANGNLGNDPSGDDGTHWTTAGVLNKWTTVFVGGSGAISWLQIGGAEFPNGVALTTPNIIYPIGAGPSSQSATRNIYRLPAGYLRTAPQDPKAGSMSFLGAPSELPYTDWNYEAGYIVTRQGDPIILRFVADVGDVTLMDDMFCEGLGARIALEVVEALTQSAAKKSTIAQMYQKFMTEARLVNGIETGATEPPLDDFIACRT